MAAEATKRTAKGCGEKAKAAASADGVVLSNEPQAESYVQTTALPVVNKEASSLPDFEEFKDWLKRTWPKMTWEWKHQVYIYKHLKRITDGDSKRLMIFMPPRHGKSELVTVRYPAYMLKKDPKMKIIIGSYNQGLANRFSRMIRNALLEDRAVSEPPAAAGGLTSDPTQVRKRLPANASTRCSFSPNASFNHPLPQAVLTGSSTRVQKTPKPNGKRAKAAVSVRSEEVQA
ncbi:MAG: hypothetical protein IPL32_15700 [Chloracidobacterium sp.]|nr:hypothetical protein [Chloracidobacterium sp.]